LFANKLKIDPPPSTGDIEEIRKWLFRFYNRIMKPPAWKYQYSDTDSLDVSNYDFIVAWTGDNNVTIGGLSGGMDGQSLVIFKGSTLNILTIECNEGSGDEIIYTDTVSDIVLPAGTIGGVYLKCIYSSGVPLWFVVSSNNRS